MMHIELFSKPGVGNYCPCGNVQRGEQGKLPGGTAVDEGDLRGADHVDDKRLGLERFHEPARVEDRQHWQERQERRGRKHGEHINEVLNSRSS